MKNKSKIYLIIVIFIVGTILLLNAINKNYYKNNFNQKSKDSANINEGTDKNKKIDKDEIRYLNSKNFFKPNILEYRSKKYGIFFLYPEYTEINGNGGIEEVKTIAKEENGKVEIYSEADDKTVYEIFSLNFKLKKDEKIKDGILRTFSENGGNCQVRNLVKGEIFYQENKEESETGNYDITTKDSSYPGESEKICGKYAMPTNSRFIYNKKYPNKIIFVQYGNSGYMGEYFIDWLASIEYYK
jgi:hypothetical protein